MKALILNSGMGSRMGYFTSEHPKCMTEINGLETILSRQLNQLSKIGIKEVVITTGFFDSILIEYCHSLELPLEYTFVKNPLYMETNYIHSIYCAREYLNDDILLMHGDLVFENEVLDRVLNSDHSCMAISSTVPLPDKDFKAVIESDRIIKIGIEYFNKAVAAQPLYFLKRTDWDIWLDKICFYCENGQNKCYAENAFNDVSSDCGIYPVDIKNMLCNEIDTPEDLAVVSAKVKEIESRTVYMCFSTDILHSGHVSIIKKAQRYGRLIIGVLSDQAVSSYKRFPIVPFEERKAMFENIAGVSQVVEQRSLSYKENLEYLQPTYVVHGDDWRSGIQKPVRDEVLSVLATYGGRLIEFPYSSDEKYRMIENRMNKELALPDIRRARLKRLIEMKGLITALEAHNGITGLLVENTMVYQDGGTKQFDAMWVSSLCDSTAKGKPDIELVDMSSRFRTVDEILDVTTKPIIFDGDTGGQIEHFIYTVKTLERMGVSMIIIEDKVGLKKNSLFGTKVMQCQDLIEHFCEKIKAGKSAQKSKDFMICARIESLVLEQGMDDALKRAYAYVDAGADAIMIHSCKEDPKEVFEFIDRFRKTNIRTPLVVVPTTYHSVTEEEFYRRGANIVIYANHLMRSGFPAMQKAAKTILMNHRAKECDELCMAIKDIITLIPEE